VKKVIALSSIYCITILITVNWSSIRNKFTPISSQPTQNESEEKTDQPNQYFEFHRAIRTPDGASSPNYPAGFKTFEINKSRNSKAYQNARLKSNGVTEWKERGPSNVPGRTRALLNIPGDPGNNTWLAGAATGGIWKTTDGGNTWTEKSADFPVMPISSFSMSDADPNLIYAGTGEFVSTLSTAVGDGIFKSTDKGNTWSQLGSTAGNKKFELVTRIITDPNNPDILLASTVRSAWSTNADETSIMRSTDGGSSWTEVYTNSNGAVEQIIYTPGNFQIQYASLNGEGVLKSTDGGLTWTLRNNGMSPSSRLELAVSPSNPGKIYASAVGTLSGTGSDLYVSSDAGENWSLVDVTIGTQAVDFLIGQGIYDNTILCDPFNENIVYYGGVSLFRSTVGTSTTTIDNYKMLEEGTDFMFLQNFANIIWDGGRLTVGVDANTKRTVEVRFGPGKSQKAHQFFVPDGATSGVPASSYTYQDYVTIPFEVWDITAEPDRQLMVSFRDQNKNGFDLIESQFPDGQPLLHSREYFYIHNVDYSETNNPNISAAGGQEFNLMYNFFPALASGQTWDPDNLPDSKLTIQYSTIPKLSATTITVADSRNQFDSKNDHDQQNLANGVHPDHHFMIPIIVDQNTKTYKIVLATDGGPFVSNTSTTPGIADGNWTFKGNTYITSQFYGADKKPGADRYIGGMQDNGTRISAANVDASNTTPYTYAIGGDGFEVLWHSLDGNRIIGSIYNNRFLRTTNGGGAWANAFNGFPLVNGVPDPSKYPFFSRLAHSKNFPDRIFAIGSDGVWRSNDFGASWSLTSITSQWGTNTRPMDVEVSQANANIVWAGNSITETRRLHVSTDGGVTFNATNNYSGVTMGVISKLASHPLEPNTAFAVFSFAQKPKILITEDLGQTWNDLSGFGNGSVSTTGFPDVAVYCLYVRPDNPDIIWVGTEIGIVESQDKGQTWTLLDDFPNVAVWDMKGQDNQVVIATHGRGIWTATIEATQASVKSPEILEYGTSPKNKLVLRIKSEETFDKVELYDNVTLVGTIDNVNPSEMIVTLSDIAPGTRNFKFTSYKGTAPFQSVTYAVEMLNLKSIENAYSTYFKSISDLYVRNFSLINTPGSAPGERRTLQSDHSYPTNSEPIMIVLHPIKVSATLPTIQYEDIAIVEPGTEGEPFGSVGFKDYVVLEATKNGLDWIPLLDGYDARFNAAWLTAFTNESQGSKEMFVHHEIDLTDKFSPNDTLLIRYRLFSDATSTGWGAAINYIAIQQAPTATEKPVGSEVVQVFPNPSNGNFTIEYTLPRPTEVTTQVLDMLGRTISIKKNSAQEVGTHHQTFNLSNEMPGTYWLVVKTNQGNKISKVLIGR